MPDPVSTIAPPETEAELLERARAIAGLSVGQLARRLEFSVPADLRRHKGWLGQLIEAALGADGSSLPEPDFSALGVELKTLPLGNNGKPRESTYVCTVPLEDGIGQRWETSWIRRKLSHVLWVPVEGDPQIPLASRYIGSPILWCPDAEEEALLRADWEELMDMVNTGELERINARIGSVLQIRPKAANARTLRKAIGPDGTMVLTNPRGFYLRPAFTMMILQRHITSR